MASTNKKYKGSMSTPAAPGPTGVLQTGTGTVKRSMSTPAAPGPTTTITPQANNNSKGSLSTQAMGRPIDMSQYMTPDQMKNITDQVNGIIKSSGGGTGSGTGGSGSPGGGSGYNGLTGLSDATAQGMAKSQEGYKPSDAVTQAQQALQSVMDQKPQGYAGKYDEALESVLQRIMNPEAFQFSLAGNELFNQLSDRYVQQGKQAMMDTMGQAAALTGGYGNSAAQIAGQQTYDQYIQALQDKGLELYDRAWEQYKYGQDQLMDQYGLLAQADATDYGRYRDLMGDWEGERDYLTGRADTEYQREYGQYRDDQSYWLNLAGMENSDANTQAQMAEQKREWDQQFEYNKMTDERKYAFDICTSILANGKMPSKAMLNAAGIGEKDAKKMKAQTKTGGGGGGGKKSTDNYYYDETTGRWYTMNDSGHPVEVPFSSIPDNANLYDGQIAKDAIDQGNRKKTADSLGTGAGSAEGNVGGDGNTKKKK